MASSGSGSWEWRGAADWRWRGRKWQRWQAWQARESWRSNDQQEQGGQEEQGGQQEQSVGQRGYPTQKRVEDVPLEQFVTCFWPVCITFYKDNKFTELQEMAMGAGCILTLKGRFTQTKKKDCVLTVKGVAAREVFRRVWQETQKMGADMSKVPLANVEEEEVKIKEESSEMNEEEGEPQPTIERAMEIQRLVGAMYSNAEKKSSEEEFEPDFGGDEEVNAEEVETVVVEAENEVVLRSRAEAQTELARQVADDEEEDDEESEDEAVSTAAGSGEGAVDSVFVRDWSDVVGEALLADDVVSAARTDDVVVGEALLADDVVSAARTDDVVSRTSSAVAFAKGIGNLIENIPEHHREAYFPLRDSIRDEMPTHPTVDGRQAVLCSHCFRRGFQLKRVLPWNLLTMLPYRDVVRYDLVLFGPEEDDTNDVLDFIQKNLGWAVRTGLLRVATAPMRFWSSPEAKNTSHVFATSWPPGLDTNKRLLVNVDTTSQPESSS